MLQMDFIILDDILKHRARTQNAAPVQSEEDTVMVHLRSLQIVATVPKTNNSVIFKERNQCSKRLSAKMSGIFRGSTGL